MVSGGRARRLRWTALLALGASALAGPAAGQAVTRYAGRVERVDLLAGKVVVSELAARGELRQHTVAVGEETAVQTAARARPWQVRGTRGYHEEPVSLADLLAGDFVVVEVVREGERLWARRITIVEPGTR